MGLLDIIHAGVKIADSVTKDLQPTVSFYKWQGQDAFGSDIFPTTPTATLRAIVEWKQQMVKASSGEVVASRLNILFLDVAALAAATGGTGLKLQDKLVLSNGDTGPIVSLDGFQDAGTGQPVATQVFI